MRRRKPAVVLVAAATILLVLSQFAAILDPLPEGLNATFFSTPDWNGPPLRSTVDPIPSTDSLYLAWRGTPPRSYSATWTGWMIVPRDGSYTFATVTEGGSSLRVGDQVVVDALRAHSPGPITGTVRLNRGVHRVLVTYYQTHEPAALEVKWARNGAPLEPLPAWLLSTRSATTTRFAVSVAIRRLAIVTVWPWFAATVLVIATAIVASLRRAYARRDSAAAFEWTLLFAGAAVLLFVLPHRITSDGEARYVGLMQMIEWREPPTMMYSVVGPLASAPFYLLGRTVASPSWWCARFNTFVLLAGIAVTWQLLRREIPPALFRKFALLLIAASTVPYHVQDYFGEVFTAVMVATGLLAVRFRHPVAGWAAVIVGVVSTPATLAGLGVAVVVRSWRTRRLRQCLPVAIAAALILLESKLRHGTLFDQTYVSSAGNPTVLTYSGRPGFSYPLFFGLLSILFSFGKGLLFYMPALLLPVRERLRAINARLLDSYDLWIAFLIGIILVYSKWWAWFGGWTWGPRFFLIAAFPASCALAIALDRLNVFSVPARFGVFVILTLSTWVAIVAAVFQLETLGVCVNDAYASLCWYVPEFSPLWRPFVTFTPPSPAGTIAIAYFAVVYLWMAAPVVRDLSPRCVAMAGDGWRALTRGERWRI
jgi:hypothetical protein